jgi:hypothetical protein
VDLPGGFVSLQVGEQYLELRTLADHPHPVDCEAG